MKFVFHLLFYYLFRKGVFDVYAFAMLFAINIVAGRIKFKDVHPVFQDEVKKQLELMGLGHLATME